MHAYLHVCVHVYTEIVLDSLKLVRWTRHTRTQKDKRECLSMSVSLWKMTSNLEI